MEEPIHANSHEFPPDEPGEETTGSPPEPESPSAEPTDLQGSHLRRHPIITPNRSRIGQWG